MNLLNKIISENDIKKINKNDYDLLAEEIREFLVSKVSIKGGHLASNLGAVELTMALHLCMDFPEDKLIFDVGHQAYTHKILTGRREGFSTLREYGGMSGFPKTIESECDCFNTGHSSTSISAAMGFAVSRDICKKRGRVAAVIGDGSLTGGMAYEALNSLAQLKSSCVIVLNDNEMSIDKNVGGLSKYLNNIRVGSTYNEIKMGVESSLLSSKAGEVVAKTLKKSKDTIKQFLVPGMFFEELGITYVGPIDGHDVNAMVSTFEKAFNLNRPIIIHVKTKKGMGYKYASKYPEYFHGVSPFDVKTGHVIEKKEVPSYTDIFAHKMLKLGKENDKLVAVTAAMSVGTGLNKFSKEYPDRFFDVGIAEQHAVTFAAGMAADGLIPVVAIYSSFLQRAYDQILHDVCLQKLHVIFAIDRSGLVGPDGETHQGIYDISYLSHMPGLTVMAPKNRYEMEKMFDYAVAFDGPIAIKYSRADAYAGLKEYDAPIVYGRNEVIYNGSDICIFACGNMVAEAEKVCNSLREKEINPSLVNVRFVNIIDEETLKDMLDKHKVIVSMEENVKIGGYGQMLKAKIFDLGYADKIYVDGSIDAGKVEHGSIAQLRAKYEIDCAGICKKIEKVWRQ